MFIGQTLKILTSDNGLKQPISFYLSAPEYLHYETIR